MTPRADELSVDASRIHTFLDSLELTMEKLLPHSDHLADRVQANTPDTPDLFPECPLDTCERTPGSRKIERRFRVGSVSSLMQEAAVQLLDPATVSNPPHC
jgi:hypothetical protein